MARCKVYHGPYVDNFKDVYEFLRKKKISKSIKNADELSQRIRQDLMTKKKIFVLKKNLDHNEHKAVFPIFYFCVNFLYEL